MASRSCSLLNDILAESIEVLQRMWQRLRLSQWQQLLHIQIKFNKFSHFLFISVHTFAYAKKKTTWWIVNTCKAGLPPSVLWIEQGGRGTGGSCDDGTTSSRRPVCWPSCNLFAPATTYGHVNSCDNIRYDVTHTHTHACVLYFLCKTLLGFFFNM